MSDKEGEPTASNDETPRLASRADVWDQINATVDNIPAGIGNKRFRKTMKRYIGRLDSTTGRDIPADDESLFPPY